MTEDTSAINELIFRALKEMKALNSVEWNFDSRYSRCGINNTVSCALGSLPLLEKVELIFQSLVSKSDTPSFSTLPNLRTLLIRCDYPVGRYNQPMDVASYLALILSQSPNLDFLDVEMPSHEGVKEVPDLKDILPDFSSDASTPIPLRYLRLSNVFITINNTRFHISFGSTHLEVNWIEKGGHRIIPPSGLKHLSVSATGQAEVIIDGTPLHRTFFSVILPGHSASLLSLPINSFNAGPWSYNSSMIRGVLSCERLEKLYITICEDDFSGDAIANLLNDLSSLRYLEHLDIAAAFTPAEWFCGNGLMDHHRHLQKKLASAVQEFRGIAGRHYPATVSAGCDHRSEVMEEEGERVNA
ncbi:uncharacterized protein STEHIDRAFT_153402 [Stereum hirsutum FP-91666 SS1]|uniref:uncharacterized protein n=1 Tax=Stereum hirsutum (strain FP-91666) TaxID=721885 RepID=UPI000440E4E5|nr:uncharacterized protein STEHIDRAFT_153402 [Stereum hirsutum FP-91666 SS1]EIM89543.1 hypothetical protein STEHIDRAFT_153402 [Stereum hirsutum FP-91666 SS1]